MTEFVTIILLIFGVLQIILFVKIWGMTNDVKRLANKFCNSEITLSGIDDSNKTQCEIIPDNTPDEGIEISIGDIVIRRKDSKEMIVDRIVCGKYGCTDPVTHTFIAGYDRNEIRKKYAHIINNIHKGSSRTIV